MSSPDRDYQREADGLVDRLTESLAPGEAALALAVLVSRAVTRLHGLSRGEASARLPRGAERSEGNDQPEWPVWAQLQNASRALVLQASTCRDLAARLAGRRQ